MEFPLVEVSSSQLRMDGLFYEMANNYYTPLMYAVAQNIILETAIEAGFNNFEYITPSVIQFYSD